MSINSAAGVALPPHQTRVNVVFHPGSEPWGEARVASAAGDWQDLARGAVAGARIERLISPEVVSPEQLRQMEEQATASLGRRLPRLHEMAAIHLPAGADAQQVHRALRGHPKVMGSYTAGVPTPPPVNSADDPHSSVQGYLDAAPRGIDARFAWGQAGGDGRGVTVVDLEYGWTLNHEDLPSSITLLSGLNWPHPAVPEHGTSVLGQLVMQDNMVGGVGIVPAATCKVVSQKRAANPDRFNTAEAILDAAGKMRRGDVLLLEAQTTVAGSSELPVECEWAEFVAILIATALGIVVVEAGANGSNDLDAWTDPILPLGKRLKRGDPGFLDSGAIMVGAADPSTRARLGFSNYGSRVDCFAWGSGVTTTSASATLSSGKATGYTHGFNGTSSASPIVAGAAVALNAMMRARIGVPYGPADARRILTAVSGSTASNTPASDKIGRMPDLRKIFDTVVRHHSASGGPAANPSTRTGSVHGEALDIIIDPGHGGEVEVGKSTPYGACGGHGLTEKELTLDVARRVVENLQGRARLTRTNDSNLSLAERSGQVGSRGGLFLSLHADSGRGPEVWHHEAADPGSQGLAQRIGRALADEGCVEAGGAPLAVLDPHRLGEGVAACLVELGDLRDPEVERRLMHPSERARISRKLADALLEQAQRYGASLSDGQVLIEPDPSYRPTGIVDALRFWMQWFSRRVSWHAGVPNQALSYFPHSAICQLRLWSGSSGPAYGTGFFIGPEKILTCGHNFFDTGWDVTRVEVAPGFSPNSSVHPKKTFTVVGRDLVHPDWRASQAVRSDLAVLSTPGLSAPGGNVFRLADHSVAANTRIVVSGYGKVQGQPFDEQPQRMDGAVISQADAEMVWYPINTIGGHSGSPVFVEDWDMVLGVHTGPRLLPGGGISRHENRAVRLVPDNNDWINRR